MKNNIDIHSVQGTMLIPLWARAESTNRFPDLLQDPAAVSAVAHLREEYDFSGIEKSYGFGYGMITSAIRAYQMDKVLRSFIAKHPKATIVSLGTGLDTTFSRVDNGNIQWVDLDLPDMIALRQSLLGTPERCREIFQSVFDYEWMDTIQARHEDGVFFLAAGLFFYFEPEQICALTMELARRFPGGELLFDACSKSGVKVANRMVEKTGNTSATMHFYVNNAKEIQSWLSSLGTVEISPFFKDIKRDIASYRSWDGTTKFNMFFGDLLHMTKFVHVYFAATSQR
jgi:O-methyltransferase involved in polyketide biosynthesis